MVSFTVTGKGKTEQREEEKGRGQTRKIIFLSAAAKKVSPKDFKVQEGGKGKNPDELTSVSDSGD
ncbi:hypothetical protein [Yersinia mollaretii]|uniref:hypothetical protein n=1 Tax=Yersinia mollaretii TaxID=33060 RepID=UPI0011A98063|nr:hypothetical protein [Yersinia mollaretii]